VVVMMVHHAVMHHAVMHHMMVHHAVVHHVVMVHRFGRLRRSQARRHDERDGRRERQGDDFQGFSPKVSQGFWCPPNQYRDTAKP
jgi:hypothetical protein